VLAAWRAEAATPVEDLRFLGPMLEAEQVLLTVDEVLTRRPGVGDFLELRTARIMAEQGYRYLYRQARAALSTNVRSSET
jgi:hypothetical protein